MSKFITKENKYKNTVSYNTMYDLIYIDHLILATVNIAHLIVLFTWFTKPLKYR